MFNSLNYINQIKCDSFQWKNAIDYDKEWRSIEIHNIVIFTENSI